MPMVRQHAPSRHTSPLSANRCLRVILSDAKDRLSQSGADPLSPRSSTGQGRARTGDSTDFRSDIPARCELRSRVPTQDEVDAPEDEPECTGCDMTDSLREQSSLDRDDPGYVRDRILRQPGHAVAQKDVAWSFSQPEAARQRHHDNRADAASIECISLDDKNGPSQTGTRTNRIRKVGPEDLALRGYHSLDRRVRRPASRTKSSGRDSTEP